ncbi:MAG: hypothetical protein Q9171_001806 [Xanthocarpia ochracea]
MDSIFVVYRSEDGSNPQLQTFRSRDTAITWCEQMMNMQQKKSKDEYRHGPGVDVIMVDRGPQSGQLYQSSCYVIEKRRLDKRDPRKSEDIDANQKPSLFAVIIRGSGMRPVLEAGIPILWYSDLEILHICTSYQRALELKEEEPLAPFNLVQSRAIGVHSVPYTN